MRKSSKEFLGVILGVLICVFLVGIFVYATTTVGNNVSVGGVISINGSGTVTEFSVLGTASISQDLWASGSFQFAGGEGVATASYSRLGGTATGHALSNANDLVINGSLEVDGSVFFDGVVSISMGDSLRTPYIYGGMNAGEYLSVGDAAATSHVLASEDDLLVTGKLEVNGTAWFDGTVSVSSGGIILDNGATLNTGVTSPSTTVTPCVVGSLYIDTALGKISICETVSAWSLISVP